MARRGLASLELEPFVDEDPVSAPAEVPLPVFDFAWDPEAERAFVYLVGPDVSDGTLPPAEGTS